MTAISNVTKSEALSHSIRLLTACGDANEQIRSVLAKHRADVAGPGRYIVVIEPPSARQCTDQQRTLLSNIVCAKAKLDAKCIDMKFTMRSASASSLEGEVDGSSGTDASGLAA
eukprot:3241727-Rhodomonas_salina.2